MGYTVFHADERDYHPPKRGDMSRGIMTLNEALHAMRANLWRLPPGAGNSRHLERVQEELFVVLEGAVTMHVGDPAEPVALPQGSVIVIEAGTVMQLRNEGEAEAVVLAVGAPPEAGQAEHFPDVS